MNNYEFNSNRTNDFIEKLRQEFMFDIRSVINDITGTINVYLYDGKTDVKFEFYPTLFTIDQDVDAFIATVLQTVQDNFQPKDGK